MDDRRAKLEAEEAIECDRLKAQRKEMEKKQQPGSICLRCAHVPVCEYSIRTAQTELHAVTEGWVIEISKCNQFLEAKEDQEDDRPTQTQPA